MKRLFATTAALGAVLALSVSQAEAQGYSVGQAAGRGSMYGHGHGGGGGGKGIIGGLIGLGVGLAAGAAAADEGRYERDEPVRGRPDRPRRPRPHVVSVEDEPGEWERGPRRPRRSERPSKQAVQKVVKAKPAAPKPPAQKPVVVAVADDPSVVPGEVLCEVRAGVTSEQAAALRRSQRLDQISSDSFDLSGSTVYRWKIRDRRSIDAVVNALVADSRVRSAQRNHVFKLSDAASGLAGAQYAIAKMHVDQAHAAATGAGVSVAVIDSGVDPDHPALKGAIAESYDPVGGAFKPHAHGTAVAGLIGARGDLQSPAPAARIYAIRAFSGEDKPAKPGAEGTTMHILRGLDWAAKKGVKIVNMSFAGPKDDKIGEFLAAGAAKGEIFVAAAGNAGPSSPPLYPAADPNVIAVTATDADGKLLDVANRGDYINVAAPGVDVLVATPGKAFGYLSGTSMSAAEVSGVVALLVQGKPDLTLDAARDALVRTAVDLGAPGIDPEFGAGEVDAKAAVDAIAGPPVAAADKSATAQPAAVPGPTETAAARP